MKRHSDQSELPIILGYETIENESTYEKFQFMNKEKSKRSFRALN